MTNEKRKYERAELGKKSAANFKVPNQLDLALASIKNISSGGVCLLTSKEIEKGTVLTLEFQLPGEAVSIVADGEVIWSEELEVPIEKNTHQMGLKFVRIDENKKEAITNFVVRYLRGKVTSEIEKEKRHIKRKYCMLIIDDDKVTRQVVRNVFEDEFEVLAAGDGHEGVKLAKDNQPDLILLDIIMPDFDGFSTLMMLKDFPETKDIPVIMLSVIRDRGKIFQALREGATDYLLKPFTTEKIVEKIRSFLYKT
ncbi:MAG: response regulator [bacterium]